MRILEVCIDLDGGGVDRYLYNYCIRMDDEIKFDFVVTDNHEKGMLEPLLEERGSKIYRVPRIMDGIISNFRAMLLAMKAQKYDAVHVHLGHKSFIALFCALLCGIKVRITHAHIAFVPETNKEAVIRILCTFITKLLSTHLVACGVDAAKWVWGEKTYASNRVRVINNAIDTSKFSFNSKLRKVYREQLSINDEMLVVGHVGRLSEQKNQMRLLDIFKCILGCIDKSILVLIGQGEMEKEVRQKVQELDLEDKVVFLGVRNDVPALLNAMDVFVFPSKYEGLPFTLIETQSNGLPCVSSDSITRYVEVSQCLSFLSLDESDEKWADEVLQAFRRGRCAMANRQVSEAGYDIDIEAAKLKQYYFSCVNQK